MTWVEVRWSDDGHSEREFDILGVDHDRTIHLWPSNRTPDLYPPDRTPAACGKTIRRGGAMPFTGAHLCKKCRAAVIEQEAER